MGGATVLVLAAVPAAGYVFRDQLGDRFPALDRLFNGSSWTRDAGRSCFARARKLRTPWVRLLTLCGHITAAEELARRCQVGGEGERHVARLLTALEPEGWVFLADRRLPTGNSNIDILAWSGRNLYVIDVKRWAAWRPVTVQRGRLLHGTRDVTSRLDGLRHETAAVIRTLATRAVPVIVMDGPMQAGEQHHIDGITVLSSDGVCAALRALDARHIPAPRQPSPMGTAARQLPSYTRS